MESAHIGRNGHQQWLIQIFLLARWKGLFFVL